MRAVRYHGRRDVRVESVPEPVVTPGSVVIRVGRCGLCGTDAGEYAHGPTLMRNTPTVMGHEFVGRVEASGSDLFRVGDRVASGAGVSCGVCRWCRRGRTNLCASYETLGLSRDGGLAGLVAAPASTLHRIPDGLPDDIAVLAQPLAVALHSIRRSDPSLDEVVVLLGAGSIGYFLALGLLDRPHARLVVADVSSDALETVRTLGDVDTCDARELDRVVADLTDGRGADLVFEATGSPGSLRTALALTARGGRVQAVGLPAQPQEVDVTQVVLAEVDIRTSVAHVCDEDLPDALRVLDVRRPQVTGLEVGLEDVVEGGLEMMLRRETRGKVVVVPGT